MAHSSVIGVVLGCNKPVEKKAACVVLTVTSTIRAQRRSHTRRPARIQRAVISGNRFIAFKRRCKRKS